MRSRTAASLRSSGKLVDAVGQAQHLLLDARHFVLRGDRLQLPLHAIDAIEQLVGGGEVLDQPLHAVEALEDGALVLAHGVEAGDLDLELVEATGDAGQPVLQIAQAVAGHVARRIHLHFHLVEARMRLLDGAGDGAAVAAEPLHLLQQLEQLVADRLDLVFVGMPLQRLDARFHKVELLLDRAGDLRLPAHRGRLGAALGRLDLGAPSRLLRVSAAADFFGFRATESLFGLHPAPRLLRLGQPSGLHSLRAAAHLHGRLFGLYARPLDLGQAPQLGALRLAVFRGRRQQVKGRFADRREGSSSSEDRPPSPESAAAEPSAAEGRQRRRRAAAGACSAPRAAPPDGRGCR